MHCTYVKIGDIACAAVTRISTTGTWISMAGTCISTVVHIHDDEAAYTASVDVTQGDAAMFCTELDCTVLHSVSLHSIALHSVAHHSVAPHSVALYSVVLHSVALHSVALQPKRCA